MNELKEKLESLSVEVFSNHDGKFTAFTTQEPFFCFVRNDLEQINLLVAETLESYVKSFYNVESVKVEMVDEIQPLQIPVRELKPVKRLAPRLPFNFGNTELAYA